MIKQGLDGCRSYGRDQRTKGVIVQTQIDGKGLELSRQSGGQNHKAKTKKRDIIIDEIRRNEDIKKIQKADLQSQQEQWTNWDTARQRFLAWTDISHAASSSDQSTISCPPMLILCDVERQKSCPLCQADRLQSAF